VDVNIQSGFGKVPKRANLLGTSDYIKLRKQAYLNSGIDFVNTFPYNLPAEYKYLFAPDLFVWNQNAETDWQKVLIGGTSKFNDAQGTISGGSSVVQYLVGGNFHRETTVFPGDNADEKGNVHISLTGASIDQRFKATITASYAVDHNMLPGIDFTNNALTLAPNAPSLRNDDGTINWAPIPNGSSSWSNPLAELERVYDAKVNNLVASADLNYKLFRYLTLKTQVGYSQLTGNSFISNGTLASTPPERINPNLIFGSNFNTNSIRNVNIEPQVSFNFAIGRGVLQGLIGGSIQNTEIEDQRLSAIGFKSDAQIRNLSSATSLTGANTSSQYRYSAVFSRLNYNWQDKYLINLTARRDGSSRFGPGNQFGNFGSLGLGWIFSNESFISKSLPILSFGKLRFSYGSAGNDGISDYAYFERYDPILGAAPYQGASGLSTTGIFNSYYHWESTKKLEAGIETGFAKDRVLFTFSYFRNRSSNQLLNASYPTTVGPGTAVINLPALIQNSGFEFTATSTNIKSKNFTWQTSANFTTNRNKLISFPNLEQSNYYATYEVGSPFYGVEKTFKQAGVDPQTGRFQFADLKGTTVVDPNDPSRTDGGHYLRIMTAPKFYGGISNTLSWKNISLDFFVQFTKQKGISFLNNYYQIAGLSPRNLPVEFLSSWQKAGDITNIQKLTGVLDNDLSRSAYWYQSSDAIYVDASFIRLKNLSLSYTIPKEITGRARIQNARIYIQGQNLLTITKYKGLDPETQSINSLPPLRVLTVGFQITL
jgi:TonB-linked SusC/RagA family outer membrane protein